MTISWKGCLIGAKAGILAGCYDMDLGQTELARAQQKNPSARLTGSMYLSPTAFPVVGSFIGFTYENLIDPVISRCYGWERHAADIDHRTTIVATSCLTALFFLNSRHYHAIKDSNITGIVQNGSFLGYTLEKSWRTSGSLIFSGNTSGAFY